MTTAAPDGQARDDDGPLLPPVVARWFERCRGGWTRADSLALLAVIASLVPVLYVAWGAGLYADDIRGLARFTPEALPDTLFWSGGSHVVPGTHLVLWLHGRIAGLDYWPVLVVVPILKLVTGLSVWRMLRRLFGPRPTTVALLAFFALLPLGVSATAWYVQALTTFPVQLATAWAVLSLLRFHAHRRLRDVVQVGAALLFGFAFAEKTAALILLLPVISALVLARSSRPRDMMRALVRDVPVWVVCVLVTLAWWGTYVGSRGDSGHPVSFGQSIGLSGRALWSGILPTLAGGPWKWQQGASLYEAAPYYGVANAPFAASVAGSLVAIAVGVVGWRRLNGRPLIGLFVFLAYFVGCVALVARARLGEIGTQVAIDLRFWADTGPVIALAAGIALIGLPRDRPTEPAATTARRAPTHVLRLLSCLWLISILVTVSAFAQPWKRNPSAAYLDQLSAELSGLPGTATVYDGQLPENVLNPIFQPHTSTAFIAATLRGRAAFGLNSATMFQVDSRGVLEPATWEARAVSGDGPVPRCGWRLSTADGLVTQISQRGRVTHEPNLSLRLDVLAGRGAHLSVWVSDGARWRAVIRPRGQQLVRSFATPPGLNALVLQLPQANVNAVRVRASSNDGVTCILRTSVGVPELLHQ